MKCRKFRQLCSFGLEAVLGDVSRDDRRFRDRPGGAIGAVGSFEICRKARAVERYVSVGVA